jgi:hypothetical protein
VIACRQCRKPFDAAVWPRSKMTMNGFSPWCPECHTQFAPHKPQRSKPGPKPKPRGVTKDSGKVGWTNLPH